MMRLRLGITRRAQWQELSEAFISNGEAKGGVCFGGWRVQGGSEQKVMLELDEAEARRLYDRLKRQFEGGEPLPSRAISLRTALATARLYAAKQKGHEAEDVVRIIDAAMK